MQNTAQYSNNYNQAPSSTPLNTQKVTSPTHFKGFDKTLPTLNIKHYASNSNLSFEVIPMKGSAITAETHTYSPLLNKKNT
jgi:hypothetical protein